MEKHDSPFNSFPASALQRQTDEVTHATSRGPVVITKHGKPRFVLMSMEDFEASKPYRQAERLAKENARLTEPAFVSVWDNDEDEAYNAL